MIINDYVKSDLVRYYGKFDRITLLKALYNDRVFRFQYAFRLCHEKGFKKKIGRILWKLNKTKRYIQIPPTTRIGYGLYIGHDAPIIINSTAIIGDNTYIGPNVCIVENVIIGNNVTIGAGSVVTKDIPDNATAVGNYAKVINYDNPGRFILKKMGYRKCLMLFCVK